MASRSWRASTGWEATRDVALGLGILSVFGSLAFLVVTWNMLGSPTLALGGLVSPVLCFGLYFFARSKVREQQRPATA